MPSTSAKQAKFMRAVAHSPKFAKKVGVSQSVGKDFEMADKRKKTKKFGDGGAAMESTRKPIDLRRSILGSDKDIVERGNRAPYEKMPKSGPKEMPYRRPKLKKAGEMGYKSGGKVKKMAVGGMSVPAPAAPAAPAARRAAPAPAPAPAAAARPAPTAAPQRLNAFANNDPRVANVMGLAAKAPAATAAPAAAPAPANFDRNDAYRAFNAQARSFYDQGVPKSEINRQQAVLRALQMDNSSSNAQHQKALADALSAMQGMIPKKGAAKGGSMKSDKAGRALVKKSADTKGRAMKFAAGGLATGHKSANGIAKKGKTKAMQVKMNKGGACYAKGGSVRGIDGIAVKGKTRCKGAR